MLLQLTAPEQKMQKMTDEEYFAHPALNHSTFKQFMRSALHYKHYLDHPPEKTKAMTIGSMVHCLYLEPEEFVKRFALFDKTKSLTSNAAKGLMTEMKKDGDHRELYTPEMVRQAEAMVAAINHPLPDPDKREVAGFSKIRGVDVKAKADWIDDDDWIWDLKTTSNLEKWEFEAKRYRYHIQAMWYLAVFEERAPQGFRWLVVGSDEPHDFRLFQASKDSLVEARSEIIYHMDLYNSCHESGEWPGFPKEIEEI
jgi:hypothetical protein